MESVRSIGKFKYNSIESEDKTLEIFTEDFSKGTNYNKVLEIRILDNKEEVNCRQNNILRFSAQKQQADGQNKGDQRVQQYRKGGHTGLIGIADP